MRALFLTVLLAPLLAFGGDRLRGNLRCGGGCLEGAFIAQRDTGPDTICANGIWSIEHHYQFVSAVDSSGPYAITTNDIDTFDNDTSLTASFWLQDDHSTNPNGYIIEHNGASSAYGKLRIFTTTGRIRVSLPAEITGQYTNIRQWDWTRTKGQFYHFLVVFDGSQTGDANRLRLWQDGVELTGTQVTGSVPSLITIAANNDNGDPWTIGSRHNGGTNATFTLENVGVDEVALFEGVLAESDAQSIFAAGRTQSLIDQSYTPAHYWRFDGALSTFPTITDEGTAGVLEDMTATRPVNGVFDIDEDTCDDGGTAAGDGCDATCNVEAGYSCSGSPSTCVLE